MTERDGITGDRIIPSSGKEKAGDDYDECFLTVSFGTYNGADLFYKWPKFEKYIKSVLKLFIAWDAFFHIFVEANFFLALSLALDCIILAHVNYYKLKRNPIAK